MKLPKLNMKNLLDSFKTRSFRVGGYSIATTAIKMNFKFFITMLLIKKKLVCLIYTAKIATNEREI